MQEVSHYRIVERLGGGGMGEVWLAEDKRLEGHTVAVKFLKSDVASSAKEKKRFLIEAKAASSLDHPHICRMHEIDETDDGRLFLVMAYYDGGSLRDRLNSGGLTPPDAFRVAVQTAEGLAYAHRHGVVHRDIKPGNLVFAADGLVRIVDFGLAKLSGNTRLTVSGTQLGTVSYMSPEQARGEDAGAPSDLWSLGVVLYESLTGALPFRGGNPQSQLYSILNDDYVPAHERNPEVPAPCSLLIDRCLRKDPKERYPSAEEFVADAIAASQKLGDDWSLSSRTVAVGRPNVRRRLTRWAAIAAPAVAVAGWLAWDRVLGRSADASPFVTDLRVAVMPFQNVTGPDNDALAQGLSNAVAEMLAAAGPSRRSMWVAEPRHVTFADLAEPDDAKDALGVNRAVLGELQRFGEGYRLTLRLRDVVKGRVIESATIDFDARRPSALVEQLPRVVAGLLDLPAGTRSDFAALLPRDPAAALGYLSGWGLVESDLAAAAAALEGAGRLAPGFHLARVRLGQALTASYAAGHDPTAMARALDELAAARRAGDASAAGCLALGEAHFHAGHADSAIAWFTQAVRLDPGMSYAANRAANLLRAQNRYDEADVLLRAVIAQEPDYSANHRDRGAHLSRIHRADEAKAEFQRALALAPNDAWSLNALGAIHYDAGEWTEAAALFERSFPILPPCESCSNDGAMYFYAGDFWSSAEYYDYAMAYCDTTDHARWGNLAKALYWTEDERSRALEAFDRAIGLATGWLEAHPGDTFAAVDLMEYYAMSGRAAEARVLLDSLDAGSVRDQDVRYQIGCVLEILGERERALEYIFDVLRSGYPRAIIEGTPELRDLVRDVRLEKLFREADTEAGGAAAGA
ncbi:MAG: protein kinase domain-containing protein [Candidatus Eiseniibacteriota bacterium]